MPQGVSWSLVFAAMVLLHVTIVGSLIGEFFLISSFGDNGAPQQEIVSGAAPVGNALAANREPRLVEVLDARL